jgi:hypothetical protein
MNNRCGKASSLSETMSSHFPVSVVRGKSERLGESHAGTRGDPGPKFRPWENLRDGNCHATSTWPKKVERLLNLFYVCFAYCTSINQDISEIVLFF